MPESVRHETQKQGVAVSAGIAIGRAYLIGRDTLKAPRHHIDADDIDTEVARLRKALAASDKQLERVKVKLASENESDYHIISAHQLMLHDEHLADAAVGYINTELVCAEWALRKAVDDIAAVFHSNGTTVGPVRSARTTDIPILDGLDHAQRGRGHHRQAGARPPGLAAGIPQPGVTRQDG
ncbi:MAG: hypothetical protein HC863_02900, partial [Myxococcales bacterium]|nr:hypothetical protein [Myxococcales bacterium]